MCVIVEMRIIRKLIIIFSILVAVFSVQLTALAASYGIEDLYEEADFSEIDEYLSTEATELEFSFSEYLEQVIYGEEEFSIVGIFKSLVQSALSSMDNERKHFSSILLITALTSLITPLAGMSKSRQTTEMSFYVSYMLLIGMLAELYSDIYQMAENILSKLLDFCEILIPAYMMGIAFSTGTATATSMYGISIYIMSLAEGVILKFLFPMINIYLCIVIANHVTKNSMFTKMTELLSSFVKWTNKTMLVAVAGMSTVQGLVSPGIDELKRDLTTKSIGTIPIVGSAISGASEIVLGAGMVLKNIIGAAGVIAILILCATPLFKIWLSQLLLKLSAAVMEPVSDKRLTLILDDTSKAVMLLFETALTSAFIFIVMLVILAAGTGL
jgi:stage III sporulation protein AE